MIIVDERTDARLMAFLEMIRKERHTTRCIYLNKVCTNSMVGMREKIITAAHHHILAENIQIYLCEDGDVFIFSPRITTQNGISLIEDIATQLNKPANERWAMIYEMPFYINLLFALVNAKLLQHYKLETLQKKRQEYAQLGRKRQAILEVDVHATPQDICKRRAMHQAPEIMIIEDDAFSRRLVKNVLQDKYTLTEAGEATHALQTYARIAPDLLFLDIDLPDVSGHELLEKLIELDPEAYIVMLSGNSDRGNVLQAMNLGAKGFVAKPFTSDKLFQYIERCPTIRSATICPKEK